MNTLHFKYAVEVEKTGSISQAAENLFMAQPNLSKAIRELEDTFGITIFRRTSKGVVPTDEGSEFLQYARNIMKQIDNMESIYTAGKNKPQRQTLKISVPRGSYISSAFSEFVSKLDMEKSINVKIRETNSVDTIKNVADNNYNFGIVRYKTAFEKYFLDYIAEKGLIYDAIWEFESLVVMNEKHPLANEKNINFDELSAMSIEIVHGDKIVPYLSVPEISKPTAQEGAPIRRICVYERGIQLDILSKVPLCYMWTSRIAEDVLSKYGLIQRACHMPDNKFKDILIYPKGYEFTPEDKVFIDSLYREKNKVAFCQVK